MRWVVVAALVLSVGVSLCGIAQAQGTRGNRRPLFVEVKKDSVTLLPNDDDYSELFGDKKPRQLPLADIRNNQDLKKLFDYVLSHKAPNGLLRGRRDTIVVFLIRPDALTTYYHLKREADEFEKANQKELVTDTLPNGDMYLDSLTAKVPLPGEGEIDTAEIRLPNLRHLPRSPDGKMLLLRTIVLVKDGKVFLFVDPKNKTRTAVQDRIDEIIKSNNIQVNQSLSYAYYIADEKKALEIIDEFNTDPVENNVFKTRLKRIGPSIGVEYTFTAAWGEKPEDAVRGNFWKYLRNDRKMKYLDYEVEPDPDSFAAYIAIRKATDSVGYHATWKPVEPGSYDRFLTSRYRIGVKPPPRKRTPYARRKPGTTKAVLD